MSYGYSGVRGCGGGGVSGEGGKRGLSKGGGNWTLRGPPDPTVTVI